jgi:hypothetical protein
MIVYIYKLLKSAGFFAGQRHRRGEGEGGRAVVNDRRDWDAAADVYACLVGGYALDGRRVWCEPARGSIQSSPAPLPLSPLPPPPPPSAPPPSAPRSLAFSIRLKSLTGMGLIGFTF